jgi:hypothetical protein
MNPPRRSPEHSIDQTAKNSNIESDICLMSQSDPPSSATTSKRSSIKVALLARGMKNICIKNKDFTFGVGSRRYDCPWFVAEFLSPYVC